MLDSKANYTLCVFENLKYNEKKKYIYFQECWIHFTVSQKESQTLDVDHF